MVIKNIKGSIQNYAMQSSILTDFTQSLRLQQTLTLDHIQIKQKLYYILTTLEQQSKSVTQSYKAKLSILSQQLDQKDHQLQIVKGKLEDIHKKYQVLQWKCIQKDNIIEDLNHKVNEAEARVIGKIRGLMDQLEGSHGGRASVRKSKEMESKKCINISEYYIKSKSNIKQQPVRVKTAQNQNESTQYSQNRSSLQNPNHRMPYKHLLHPAPTAVSPTPISHMPKKQRQMRDCLKNDSDPTDNVYLKVPIALTPPRLEKVKSFDQNQMRRSWGERDDFHEDINARAYNGKSNKRIEVSERLYQSSRNQDMQVNNNNARLSPNKKNSGLSRHKLSPAITASQQIYLNPHSQEQFSPSQHIRTQSSHIDSPTLTNQQRKAKLQQRWKQISAFEQKRNPNSNLNTNLINLKPSYPSNTKKRPESELQQNYEQSNFNIIQGHGNAAYVGGCNGNIKDSGYKYSGNKANMGNNRMDM